MSKIAELKLRISKANAEIREIQALCNHPKPCLSSKWHEITDETGNDLISAYTAYSCSLCEAKWTETLKGSLK